MPGIGELIIILVIILVVFGAGKLPQIGDALGRSIRNFKRASSGKEEVEVGPKVQEISVPEEKAAIEDPPEGEPAEGEPTKEEKP
jgi:sec-independent protein translocase protein TatA